MSRVRIPSPAPLRGSGGRLRRAGEKVRRVPGPHAGNRRRAGFTKEAAGGRKATSSRAYRIHSGEPAGGSGGCDATPPRKKKAHVAQSAERVLGKDEVISSILIVGSNSSGEGIGNGLRAKRDSFPAKRAGSLRAQGATSSERSGIHSRVAKRGSGGCGAASLRRKKDGQGEVRPKQAAREHRDDRSRGPREDVADGGDHEVPRGDEPEGSVQGVRPDRQRAGGARARGDDQRVARGVRDGEPSLRARGLPGSRGLHQEHDHGGGADGRVDPGGLGGGRSDASDAGAHPAGAPGGGSVHRGVPEQGGHGGRPGAFGPGGARGA